MTLYQFADISHHKGDLDIQIFADAGHRMVISKASDNYHMPDVNGQYDFPAERHYDARFVQNFTNTRATGLVAGAYHFCRFDRPLPVSNRAEIVQANLDYFQIAVGMLPEEQQAEVVVAILDMEQSADQLRAAGLNRLIVSDMAKDIVALFLEHFAKVILYSGSWWTDEWLTPEATQWMAERVSVWEPEYITTIGNNPANPDYKPSVPLGFTNTYVTTEEDFIGNMFAWQYTPSGRFPGITPNIDLNQYAVAKEVLYAMFGQDGAVDPPGNGDHDQLSEEHALILDNQAVILDDLDELKLNMATLSAELTLHHQEVMAILTSEPTDPPDPPPSDTVTLLVTSDKARVPLSYPKLGYNHADPPRLIMEIFPGDGSEAGERVLVLTNTTVKVFKDPIKTDGGQMYYKIADYDALSYFGSSKANIPADFSPEKDLKALYIHTKFL